MIPARPPPPPAPTKETISQRIARLRREEAAGTRRRYNAGAPPQPESSAPRWLGAAASASAASPSSTSANSLAQVRPRNSDPRRGTAGPAPPPSWTVRDGAAVAVDGRNRHGMWIRPRELVERQKLARSLTTSETAAEEGDGIPSLFQVAGGVLAADVASGADDSLLFEHLAYLPNHLRVRLLGVFADWRNPYPLTDDSARELLRTDVSDGRELDGLETALIRARIHGDNNDEEEPLHADGDWEDTLAGQDADLVELLSRLDLSFSLVSVRTLRTLLLRPAGPVTTLPNPTIPTPLPKLVGVFPHLHTLNLTATARIPFSDAFFDLLSHLVSLHSLSLAGKSLTRPPGTATSASFLPRLAAATPTLHELDLSFMDELPRVAVKGVDWDVRWLDLRLLGLRSAWVDWQGDEIGPDKRERIRQEVRNLILHGRQKKRRWIEVVV